MHHISNHMKKFTFILLMLALVVTGLQAQQEETAVSNDSTPVLTKKS